MQAAAVGTQYLKADAVDVDQLVAPGNMPRVIQDEAADRVARIAAELNTQRRIEVLDTGSRLDAVAPAPIDLDVVRRFVKVVFVLDIADNLLEHVLDRNQAADPRVFINDDRHVIMRDAKLAQQDIEALRFGNKYRRVQPVVQIDAFPRRHAQQVLGDEDAEHIIAATLDDRKT